MLNDRRLGEVPSIWPRQVVNRPDSRKFFWCASRVLLPGQDVDQGNFQNRALLLGKDTDGQETTPPAGR